MKILKQIIILAVFFSLVMATHPTQTYAARPCELGVQIDVWYGLDHDSEVRKVQRLLIQDGYLKWAVTGNFRDRTRDALFAYQKAKGLYPTGTVGEITRHTMNEEICPDIAPLDAGYHTEKSVVGKILESFLSMKRVNLTVPLVEQIYPLSCEAASLEMALRYKGITDVSQDALLGSIGLSLPMKKTLINGEYVWGDPDIGFVGDVKGYVWAGDYGGLKAATGWGVNNGPVARVVKQYRPDSEEKDNGTIADIQTALDAGNPVIFWHVRDDQVTDTLPYVTPEGKHFTIYPNHVSVITGYEQHIGGTLYIITDPKYGRFVIDEATLVRWWGKYHNDMVIVR